MGQYYVAVILTDNGKIRLIVDPTKYNSGIKLMEHAYTMDNVMIVMDALLNPDGIFYKSPVVWAGDYADTENDENFYTLSLNEFYKSAFTVHVKDFKNQCFRFVVNHSKRMFVDKEKCQQNIHPLPLLTNESNGRGGGDYSGVNEELCGTWARDIISVEVTPPEGYTELDCQFEE
jgi:hypothetical protein